MDFHIVNFMPSRYSSLEVYNDFYFKGMNCMQEDFFVDDKHFSFRLWIDPMTNQKR